MSELHPSDRKALLRAGFTEREIATQKRKFYNLTQINPCYTNELKQFDRLMGDRRELLEALHSISLASQDSGSTREGMGLYARAAIAAAKGEA